MDDRKKYRVGYGNPPQESQFRPGKSGNPRGRPRGAFGVMTILRRSLEAKGTDGKSALEKIVDALVTQALAGDHAISLKLVNATAKHDEKLSDIEEPPDEHSI
jgi:Family of unknown function (DUF5681)